MPLIETQLLSKVLEDRNFYILKRFNIDETDFQALADVYRFISSYVKEHGQTPDYRTVIAQFPDFDFQPTVYDSYKYLCTALKSQTAKRRAFEILQKQAADKFSQLSGVEFVKWLKGEMDQLDSLVSTANTLGTNYATNGSERRKWYEDGKEKRTFRYIPTPYPSLTEWLGGGFELGDYILLMAYTNRGKSWLASDIGLAAWKNGFGVLHYSPELSKQQQIFRLDTLNGHYNNVDLRRGKLENEEEYFRYLDQFNEQNETPYLIKCMEDLPDGLSLATIEADLQMNPNISLVIIDGFNLMVHSRGKNDRNAMTTTSRRLRQIFGQYSVAGLVVHQTPTASENGKEDETGMRIVEPPDLTDYSETIAVIQDAATVITFDQFDGVGKLKLCKAREPNVGKVLELSCNFNLGYIREVTPVDHF